MPEPTTPPELTPEEQIDRIADALARGAFQATAMMQRPHLRIPDELGLYLGGVSRSTAYKFVTNNGLRRHALYPGADISYVMRADVDAALRRNADRKLPGRPAKKQDSHSTAAAAPAEEGRQ